jgi:spore germination cell wall hydrolase CwlJ-like protein
MTLALTHRPAHIWRDYPRETLVLGLLGFVASAAFATASYNLPSGVVPSSIGKAARAAPPAPPPMLVRELAPEDALNVNGTIPLATGPNPAAAPFRFTPSSSVARAQAVECLTSAVYYEAGSEDIDGQRAVAQVVLNRVRHPAFPASVCGVVFEGSTRVTGCQFTFTCDGSLLRRPSVDGWARARKVAEAALNGAVFAPIGYATHYHANYVVPYWASSLAKNAIVGAHIFYRWAGSWGRAAAFVKPYSGLEPNMAALKSAALAAEAAAPPGAQPAEVAQAIEVIPGAEAANAAPGRVAVRFKLEARKAVEEATHHDYVDKFAASDNLRWSLSGDVVKESEQPLGKAKASSTIPAAVSGTGAP